MKLTPGECPARSPPGGGGGRWEVREVRMVIWWVMILLEAVVGQGQGQEGGDSGNKGDSSFSPS